MAKKHSLLKGLAVGAGLGIAGGTAMLAWQRQQKQKQAESVLTKVKNTFAPVGQLTGSWIICEVEHVLLDDEYIAAYRGGITYKQAQQVTAYEFLADAQTGAILTLKRS